jgi:hypothetical protein
LREETGETGAEAFIIKEDAMEITILSFVFISIVLLDMVAMRWGFDSRDDLNSPEWQRRRVWGLSL